MIVVAAMITVADGKGDEYLAHFKKLAPQVRKDPGAITYVMHRKIDDPNKFFVFEQYKDQAALKYHGETPHFKAYRQATADLVKGREVGLYQEVV
ncbi:MAG: putative quinol monooxygenase [Dehalococcoidales bacterium]|nr:putative quinol monooxygenase [Dehalococcoidales bacterium]